MSLDGSVGIGRASSAEVGIWAQWAGLAGCVRCYLPGAMRAIIAIIMPGRSAWRRNHFTAAQTMLPSVVPAIYRIDAPAATCGWRTWRIHRSAPIVDRSAASQRYEDSRMRRR